ncbi:MAG: 2-C-methyl-D-erythritol 2,4-cyclodiphosphate synthase [Desulfobacterales bacterium]|nr:MAG: 2-C-methyl-D-erythritol 2,4-cyclodiphosphate synthase [Desulfobacterales bacterium]
MRVGLGYDIHRLVPGRKLVLGGVTIPFDKGLIGHSDADVLVHAVCDALLGAANLGDIGIHFPDTDPRFKGISSIKLLAKTHRMVKNNGFKIINIDSVVITEAPKISTFRDTMRKNIAIAIEIDPNCVNVKATTTEGLGIIGKGEGIGAMCVALID